MISTHEAKLVGITTTDHAITVLEFQLRNGGWLHIERPDGFLIDPRDGVNAYEIATDFDVHVSFGGPE
jgi:hypothetical protein